MQLNHLICFFENDLEVIRHALRYRSTSVHIDVTAFDSPAPNGCKITLTDDQLVIIANGLIEIEPRYQWGMGHVERAKHDRWLNVVRTLEKHLGRSFAI